MGTVAGAKAAQSYACWAGSVAGIIPTSAIIGPGERGCGGYCIITSLVCCVGTMQRIYKYM